MFNKLMIGVALCIYTVRTTYYKTMFRFYIHMANRYVRKNSDKFKKYALKAFEYLTAHSVYQANVTMKLYNLKGGES